MRQIHPLGCQLNNNRTSREIRTHTVHVLSVLSLPFGLERHIALISYYDEHAGRQISNGAPGWSRTSVVSYVPDLQSGGIANYPYRRIEPLDGFEPPYEPYEDPVLPLYDRGKWEKLVIPNAPWSSIYIPPKNDTHRRHTRKFLLSFSGSLPLVHKYYSKIFIKSQILVKAISNMIDYYVYS